MNFLKFKHTNHVRISSFIVSSQNNSLEVTIVEASAPWLQSGPRGFS